MFERVFAIAGLTGMSVLASPTVTAAADAVGTRRPHVAGPAASARRAALYPIPASRRSAHQRRRNAPPGCTTDYSTKTDYFIGVPGDGNDVAGADDTGILSAELSDACSGESGVGAGIYNVVGGGDPDAADWSFIAGGYENGIDNTSAFIGGGNFNEVVRSLRSHAASCDVS